MDAKEVMAALAAPFEAGEVKFKPQTVKGNRALAIGYIDSRAVQDRLDEVLGPENWQDDYTVLPDGSVVCKLSVRVGGDWVSKMDVGSPSEQPDHGDRLKAAFSDALKRAAVKFGVGRYLYRMAPQWCDYDPVKKQFTTPPRLPQGGSATAPPRPQSRPAAPGDNLDLRKIAVGAYEQCRNMTEFREIGVKVKADAEAGKFTQADLLTIRQAAGAAQDRLAGAAH